MESKLLVGQKSGELTIIGTAPRRPRPDGRGMYKMWLCQCSCGRKVEVETQNFRRPSSCGCKRTEKLVARNKTHPHGARPSHGATVGRKVTPEYRSWISMRQRCRAPLKKDAKVYNGVFVCERWKNFAAFLEDMGPRPSLLHTIDRKDNRKGYEPDNCRWATKKQQSQNRRSVRMLTFNGKTQCVADWARELGVDPRLLYDRIKYRLPLEKVLSAARIGYGDRRPPGQGNSRSRRKKK